MAMTGTGTSADPFVPTNWGELKTACATANAYISLPANGSWDMNEQYPTGVPAITSNGTAHISGNGFTIDNLYAENIIVFSGTFAISNLDVPSMKLKGSSFLAPADSNSTFENVRLSGELNDSMVCYTANVNRTIKFRRCSMNYNLVGNAKMCVTGNYMPNMEFTHSHIELKGTTSHSSPCYIKLGMNSKLSGNLTSTNNGQVYLSENSTDSVVDIGLSGFTTVTGYNPYRYPIVVNASKVGTATVYANFISATAEQMKDADWLSEHGFPAYSAP